MQPLLMETDTIMMKDGLHICLCLTKNECKNYYMYQFLFQVSHETKILFWLNNLRNVIFLVISMVVTYLVAEHFFMTQLYSSSTVYDVYVVTCS